MRASMHSQSPRDQRRSSAVQGGEGAKVRRGGRWPEGGAYEISQIIRKVVRERLGQLCAGWARDWTGRLVTGGPGNGFKLGWVGSLALLHTHEVEPTAAMLLTRTSLLNFLAKITISEIGESCIIQDSVPARERGATPSASPRPPLPVRCDEMPRCAWINVCGLADTYTLTTR
eukprot:6203635-Pleurochrysis_carterae.AAC.1